MKKLLTIFLATLVFSCQKESNMVNLSGQVDIQSQEEKLRRGPKEKITICHINDEGEFVEKSITPESWPDHQAHGDKELQSFYLDSDGDGYGDASNEIKSCSQPEGYVSNADDCNDIISAINPGSVEICDNGVDDDCDGNIDESDADCESCSTSELLSVELPDGTTLFVHATDNSTSIGWGTPDVDISGLSNIISVIEVQTDFDGAQNTRKIVDQLGPGNYAAKLCDDLVAYNCDDWYLPSFGELNAIYTQIGSEISTGLTTYWSSTEHSASIAWRIWFNDGALSVVPKDVPSRCRCVRK